MDSIDEILATVKRSGITTIRFIYLANDGILRAKMSHADFLRQHLETGIGMTKAMQSFNALDLLVPGGAFGPQASEYRIFPMLETFAIVPYVPKNARFIGELYELDLKPSKMDSRYFLRRVIEQLREAGYEPMAALETEFYLLNRGEGRVTPQNTEKCFAVQGYNLANEVIQELVDSLSSMNVKTERVIKEYGPGQYEYTVRYADALKAADDMLTLREAAKGVATKHNLRASFMPKPSSKLPGSGMHLHISLWDREDKRNLFYDGEDKRGCNLSELGYYFIGGIIKHMRALGPIVCPLSNSYKRLLPGSWAPSHVCYGNENRAAAIRIPSELLGSRGKRIEFRMPDPSANPYLAIGATLAAGFDGIKNAIDPGDPMNLDYPEIDGMGAEMLPRTLGEALREMKGDSFLREVMGEAFFDEYVKVRESEWKAYREYVTEWEVNNFIDAF